MLDMFGLAQLRGDSRNLNDNFFMFGLVDASLGHFFNTPKVTHLLNPGTTVPNFANRLGADGELFCPRYSYFSVFRTMSSRRATGSVNVSVRKTEGECEYLVVVLTTTNTPRTRIPETTSLDLPSRGVKIEL